MKTVKFKTPTQTIIVKPFAYVGDNVSVEIPKTEISFVVNINELTTMKGERVTRMFLSDLFEN